MFTFTHFEVHYKTFKLLYIHIYILDIYIYIHSCAYLHVCRHIYRYLRMFVFSLYTIALYQFKRICENCSAFSLNQFIYFFMRNIYHKVCIKIYNYFRTFWQTNSYFIWTIHEQWNFLKLNFTHVKM